MICSIFLQNLIGPKQAITKVFFTLSTLGCIQKNMFYLRVFDNTGPIVIMIRNVVSDLQNFLIFYFIMMVFFAYILSVFGMFNVYVPGGF